MVTLITVGAGVLVLLTFIAVVDTQLDSRSERVYRESPGPESEWTPTSGRSGLGEQDDRSSSAESTRSSNPETNEESTGGLSDGEYSRVQDSGIKETGKYESGGRA